MPNSQITVGGRIYKLAKLKPGIGSNETGIEDETYNFKLMQEVPFVVWYDRDDLTDGKYIFSERWLDFVERGVGYFTVEVKPTTQIDYKRKRSAIESLPKV